MWYLIGICIILIIIGLIVNIVNIRKRVNEYNFANEYYEKFQRLVSDVFEKKNIKNKEYAWLMSNCDKMQYILGEAGIISFTQFNKYYKNIPILLNIMNEITSYINDPFVGDDEIKMVNWCQNAFLRKTGILNEYIQNEPKKLVNPFYNLSSGIRFILLIPIGILNSIGLISNDGKSKIGNNIIIRMLSGIISLLTILSVIITIVVGWNDFLRIVKNILNI